MSLRRWLYKVHYYTGLMSGICMLLIGLSGSILVYFNELERAVNPSLYNLDVDQERFSYDSIYHFVASKYHDGFVNISMNVPRTNHEVVSFTLVRATHDNTTNPYFLVSVNPYTLEVMRQGSYSSISTSFMHWILLFHDSMHLGKVGLLIVACIGLIMFISITSGIYIYGKNITAVIFFRLKLRRNTGAGRLRIVHRYVGVWAVMFNIVVFGTGFWMLRGMFTSDAWAKDVVQKNYTVVNTQLDSCILKTQYAFDDIQVGIVNFPESDSGQLVVSGHRESANPFFASCYCYFNQRTSRLEETYCVADDEFSSKLEDSIWDLHTGSFGGHLVKTIYVLGGLTPGILSLTGFLVWSRKRGRPKRSLGRLVRDV